MFPWFRNQAASILRLITNVEVTMKFQINNLNKFGFKSILAGVTIASLIIASYPVLGQQSKSDTSVTEVKTTIADFTPKAGFADLIEAISPSVVHVAISGTPKSTLPEGFNFPPGSPFEEFFKQIPRQQQTPNKQRKRRLGIGSGFIISEDGYVITNNHVIDGGEDITVTLANSQEYDAELVGTDKETDLAVLKIEADEKLPFVPWGDDTKSRVGDWVIAIGHPFGLEGGASASTGIISAMGRNISSGRYDNYIQSDAAINRGNSGGPLFNLDGEVIGINTAILSPSGGSVGVGFSISSTLAKSVVDQLVTTGKVERGLIGVQISPVNDAIAESIGRKNKKGALVEAVIPGKPADKAGLKAGDLILKFNGQEIVEMRNLPRIVAGTKVGKKVPIEIWRDGKTVKKTIKVEKLATDSFASLSKPEEKAKSQLDEELGAEVVTLNDQVREQYEFDENLNGVLLLNVQPAGLAAQNGLQSGDVIVRVGKKTVTSVKSFKKAIEKAKNAGASSVAMFISRAGGERFRAFSF